MMRLTSCPSTVSAPSVLDPSHRAARSGLGSSTVVTPRYVHRRGRDAMVGSSSLYRHGRSSTSSAKPSSTMKQMDMSAAL